MTGFDSVIFKFLNDLTGKLFLVDGAFVFFSEYLIYVLTIIFGIYLLRIKNWKERMQMFSLGIISVIISRGIFTPLIRFFFDRPRPFVALDVGSLVDHAQTGSFPSGHLAFITPLVIALWYINKRAGNWGFVCVLLMGISRIGVGVHWPSDILGGILIGVVAFAITQLFLKRSAPEKIVISKKENGAP